MTVRFLLFHGQWENEGKFCVLETKKSIILLATGQDYSLNDFEQQQIGRDYLKEKRSKIQAIIINNTNFHNIGLLANICQDLGPQIPLYASSYSKLILLNLWPKLKNRIIIAETNKEKKIGDFVVNFLPLNSYLLGNVGVACHYFHFSFYFLESFFFSALFSNKLLTQPDFLSSLQHFLAQKKKYTYLITSFQDMHWYNDNSLFLVKKKLPSFTKPLFFIFYEFDWLHLFELFEIIRQQKKKVKILNPESVSLFKQILDKNPLNETINYELKNPSGIYLLMVNPENMQEKISTCLENFSSEEKANFHFILTLPPIREGEEKLALLVDYLYTQSEEIANFSKSEYTKLGTSFTDFQLLLQLLQPSGIIALQNSYKNSKFLTHLSETFLPLTNGHVWDFSNQKKTTFRGLVFLPSKKTLISLEELLVNQRKNLGETGLLIILLITEWKGSKLQLKKIEIRTLAVTSIFNIEKLETKIKKWWENKVASDLKKSEPNKVIKKVVERRLNGLINYYTNLEYGIELEESLIFLFIR